MRPPARHLSTAVLSLPQALRSAMSALLAAVLVAGCGGGSEQSAGVGHARHGLVYPPRQGIEFVEYAADGSVLQRSTPTDADGRFTFERPVSGARVAAVLEQPLQQPEVLSARFAGTHQDIVVTPLTTVFDQSIESGRDRAEAEQGILGIIDGAGCSRPSADVMRTALYADTAATTLNAAKHLLHAWSAHLRALRAIGFGLEAVEQTAAIQHRLDVLRRQCDLAQRLLDPVWLSRAYAAAADRLGLSDPRPLYWIRLPSAAFVDELLTLLDDELRVREYPQIEPLLSPALQAWRGRETQIAEELLLALLVGRSDSVVGPMRLPDAAVERTGYRRRANYGLTPDGRVVGKRREVVRFATASGEPRTIRLRNDGPSAASVVLDIAGHLPIDMPGVVRAVLAAPFSTSEPLYLRAWRYVVAATWHNVPIAGTQFIHDPPLFLRSVGGGFCDDRATVLRLAWSALGYESRIWSLNGHIVPEVQDGQYWRMLDPDLGVYYLRRNGEIANVVDLQSDPTLITSPYQPIHDRSSDAGVRYSDWVASLYASGWDNTLDGDRWHTSLPRSLSAEIVLPLRAELEVLLDRRYAMPTIEDGFPLSTAIVRIRLPQGFVGRLPLPFVVADIRGEGTITLLGNDVDVAATSVAALVAAYYKDSPNEGIREISVLQTGPAGLTIDMLINPKPFEALATAGLEITLTGDGASALTRLP
jgi:hypothetical protein